MANINGRNYELHEGHLVRTRKSYKLRDYKKDDFSDENLFIKSRCYLCGHHIPTDQVVKIGRHFMHKDVAICEALIYHKGRKYMELAELEESDQR